MKNITLVVFSLLMFAAIASAQIIIDHTCTDLSSIPTEWIDSVKANVDFHYAHTSHGGQLCVGADSIESDNPFYAVEFGYCSLPSAPNTFCVFDGQEGGDDYIYPEMYWATADGMNMTRDVLNHNPSIHYSAFAWCGQLYDEDYAYVQAYLDSMSELESEFPEVTFIYFTSHAQYGDDDYGANRYYNNEHI